MGRRERGRGKKGGMRWKVRREEDLNGGGGGGGGGGWGGRG